MQLFKFGQSRLQGNNIRLLGAVGQCGITATIEETIIVYLKGYPVRVEHVTNHYGMCSIILFDGKHDPFVAFSGSTMSVISFNRQHAIVISGTKHPIKLYVAKRRDTVCSHFELSLYSQR